MMQILKYNILFFLFGFAFLISFQVSGQKVLPIDHTELKKLKMPKSAIEKYKKDKIFSYEQDQEAENFFTRAYNWIAHKIK